MFKLLNIVTQQPCLLRPHVVSYVFEELREAVALQRADSVHEVIVHKINYWYL